MVTYKTKLNHLKQLYHDFNFTVWAQLNRYPHPELYHHLLTDSLSPVETDILRHQLCQTSHHRDTRKVTEYAGEILLNWLLEDLVISRILTHKFKSVQLTGGDQTRQFLAGPKVTAMPDLKADGNQYDLKCDWTGYWKTTNTVDLRDSEYPHLVKWKAGLVLIRPFDKQIGILETISDLVAQKNISHPIWHKPYYAVKLPQNLNWEGW